MKRNGKPKIKNLSLSKQYELFVPLAERDPIIKESIPFGTDFTIEQKRIIGANRFVTCFRGIANDNGTTKLDAISRIIEIGMVNLDQETYFSDIEKEIAKKEMAEKILKDLEGKIFYCGGPIQEGYMRYHQYFKRYKPGSSFVLKIEKSGKHPQPLYYLKNPNYMGERISHMEKFIKSKAS